MLPFPHPAHRTGLAERPHPALGESLTISPRKTAGPLSETDQAQAFMENVVRELLGRLPRNSVLATQPLAQPLASMTVHGTVGFADWSKTEALRKPLPSRTSAAFAKFLESSQCGVVDRYAI
jgi:hypothetical protein